MVASDIIPGAGVAKRINIFCLFAMIIVILVLPFEKRIWYDETVSILCAKGISHDTPAEFAGATTLSSAQIEQLNTQRNVFNATVIDNANSFLYNYILHWTTRVFGNTIDTYTILSKLCAIVTLLAFYFLSRHFFRDTLFTALAVLLLGTDMNFVNISHEIRAYSMGTMFVVLAAVCFYKFLAAEKPLHLFLTSLFSACALLSHFLAVYIIVVFLVALLLMKGKRLFTLKNVLAVIIPIIPLALFLYISYTGLQVMSNQSNTIQQGYAKQDFQLSEVFLRSLKHASADFKVIFPVLKEHFVVAIASFLLVLALYITGLKSAVNKEEKGRLHLLFALGISGTLLLMVLSIGSHHYTSLYFRYHSFSIPFSSLFIGYALYVLYKNNKITSLIRIGSPVLFLGWCIAYFVVSVLANPPQPSTYDTFATTASTIVKNRQTTLTVQKWQDAFLVQSLLPKGYKIDYFRAE